MEPDKRARARRSAPKTRSGCIICKGRHVRCDERKPTCWTCERLGIQCLGYNTPKAWIFEPSKIDSVNKPGTYATDSQAKGQAIHSRREQLPITLQLYRPLLSNTGESSVLVQAYIHYRPHIWDSIPHQSPERAINSKVDELATMWSSTAQDGDSLPLRYHSYLAVATSLLVLFHPDKYPIQLYFKYLHPAIAKMRRMITQNSFDPDDLLSGISHTLMASIVLHDVVSARAHLSAAAALVTQIGGMGAIDHRIVANLRYADFHLAVATLRAPLFAALFIPNNTSVQIQTPVVDPVLMQLCANVRTKADSADVPTVVVSAVHGLLDAALVLAHAFSKVEGTKKADLVELSSLPDKIAATVSLLLSTHPSVLYKDDVTLLAPRASGLDDWTLVLIMWFQLLYCCTNEPLGGVSIRTAVLPMLSHRDPSADATRALLSRPVQEGLRLWNDRATYAQTRDIDDDSEDWPSLVDVVAYMERAFPVRVAAVVRRLFVVCRAKDPEA